VQAVLEHQEVPLQIVETPDVLEEAAEEETFRGVILRVLPVMVDHLLLETSYGRLIRQIIRRH
jgi:ribosome-interacting GTPase 1